MNNSSVLIRPHITEKATDLSERNVYAFRIATGANKQMVRNAIRLLYGVVPEKVSVVTIKSKRRIVRGKRGMKSGGKKAYVYLKSGDTIEFA